MALKFHLWIKRNKEEQDEKKFFSVCPELQCDELSTDEYHKINEYYNSEYEKSFLCKKIFDTVCAVDKTLLTLIAGSLTSLSVNLVTDFMELQNTISCIELFFRFLQFISTCGFNIYVIRFTAKVIYIHESGEKYFPSRIIPQENLETARYNLMFYACMNHIRDLKRFLIIGGGCAVGMFLSLLFKNMCYYWLK